MISNPQMHCGTILHLRIQNLKNNKHLDQYYHELLTKNILLITQLTESSLLICCNNVYKFWDCVNILKFFSGIVEIMAYQFQLILSITPIYSNKH